CGGGAEYKLAAVDAGMETMCHMAVSIIATGMNRFGQVHRQSARQLLLSGRGLMSGAVAGAFAPNGRRSLSCGNSASCSLLNVKPDVIRNPAGPRLPRLPCG